MTRANPPPNLQYLDATNLAVILGVSPRTITLRARHRPWLLPPRAALFDRELLRWRQDDELEQLSRFDTKRCGEFFERG
jgi:hypothetical protein